VQDFKNLLVWQAARALAKSTYEITAAFPDSEQFGLQSQMRRASISICSNIAEGCGRRGDREFKRYLHMALASACELECELILSCDLGLIPMSTKEAVLGRLSETKRMLGGLITRLAIQRKPNS
jgi:four helix bundle protein